MATENPIQSVSTPKAPAAVGPYSQGIRAGNLLFISGQIPLDPETGLMVEGGIEEKTRRVIENVLAVAEAAGADLNRIVKMTVFMKDLGQFAAMNGVYADFFGVNLPARAAVQVAALPKDADIEMEAILYLGD
jgi:2-iminobutanoate/2-iminopropanoate deaminase